MSPDCQHCGKHPLWTTAAFSCAPLTPPHTKLSSLKTHSALLFKEHTASLLLRLRRRYGNLRALKVDFNQANWFSFFLFFFKPFSEVLLVPVLEHCEILQHAFGEGNGNPLQYSCLENPWTEEPGRLQSMGSQELDTTWWLNQHHHSINWGALT